MGACWPNCCRCLCCKRAEDDKPKHDPVFVDEKDRKCTDVLCLVLFIVFWVGMFIIAGIGISQVTALLLQRCCCFPTRVFDDL